MPAKEVGFLKSQIPIGQTVIAQLKITENQRLENMQTVSAQSFNSELIIPPDKLIAKLSFSHLTDNLPLCYA